MDLDHHGIWIIITGSRSSLLDQHHWCYLMILLITWISTQLALFHAGCRPSHNVGLHPTLTSDHVGTNPIIISERQAQHSHLTMREPIPQPCQKGPTLTFDTCEEPIQHTCSKRLSNYIWNMRGTNPTYMFKKALHLHSTNARDQSNMHVRKGSALTFDTCEEPSQHACLKGLCTYIQHMQGTNPACMFERDFPHIWSCRNQSYSHIRMAPGPRLSYLVTDQVPPFSQRMVWALISDQVGTIP